MHGFGMLTSAKLVSAFDLSRFRRMVDLGGATGHLVMAACERYPNCAARCSICRASPRWRARGGDIRGGERIEVLAGDFFEDELPEADLYSVGRILHDWSEDKIDRLLRRINGGCRPAAPC